MTRPPERVLADISWRMGQLRALERSVTRGAPRQLTAEDLDTTQHQLTGYVVADNSPTAGSIAWTDLHMVYSGTDYPISDANTGDKYAWWDHTNPGSLKTGNTKPSLGREDVLVFINDGGTAIVAISDSNRSLPHVLADDAVDAGAILAGAVGSPQLANDAVVTGKIAGGAVGSAQLGGSAVTSDKIADKAVGSAALATNAVGASNIASGAVGTSELGDGAATSDKIADKAVGTGKLSDTVAGNITTALANASQGITDAAEALSAAQAAQAAADGAIRTYYLPDPPWPNGAAGHDNDLGDLWYDVDNDVAHRWDGDTWQLIQDTAINTALAAAQNAQATADGKITTFFEPSTNPPTAEATGDLWIVTNQDNLRKWWDGNSWEPLPVGTDALSDAAVTSTKLGNSAVTNPKIANGAVQTAQLGGGAVTNDKLGNDAVGSSNIQIGAVSAPNLDVLTHILY